MWVHISYFQTVIADLNLSSARQTEFEIGCIICVFFCQFCDVTKVTMIHRKDLAKFGYKLNMEIVFF
jgi:hypothetical protein